MIYVIGNSHANFFSCTHPSRQFEWNTVEPFSAISIGPPTAYHVFDKYKWAILAQGESMKPQMTDADYLMPAFGEVDCRVHLINQAKKQERELEDVVRECFMRYTRLYDFLEKYGYKIMVWGGQANSPKEHDPHNQQEPVFYSSIERNNVTKIWAGFAKLYAKHKKYPYLDLIDELLLTNGAANPEYFMDYCHLKYNKCMPLLKKKMEGVV